MSWFKRFFNLNIYDFWVKPEKDTVYRQTANPNATNSELDAKRVICYNDDKEVDCFTDKIESEGYTYNDIRDWWERTWTTNQGKESILEVYKKDDDGWRQLMIGYGDNIFYEEKVK